MEIREVLGTFLIIVAAHVIGTAKTYDEAVAKGREAMGKPISKGVYVRNSINSPVFN